MSAITRLDGWPLCPQCGEDELWSEFQPGPPNYVGTLAQYLAAPLHCYACQWSGHLTVEQGGRVKYRRIRPLVEAKQYREGMDYDEAFGLGLCSLDKCNYPVGWGRWHLHTPEGMENPEDGDWIIQFPDYMRRVVPRDEFEAKYESVETAG